jgi:NAD(P) transhydrogenase subunit alpha
MKIGVPKETRAGERRVAATPETIGRLKKLGFDVVIEHDAGAGASFYDDDYRNAGATVVDDVRDVWAAEIILKVQPPEQHAALGVHEADLLQPGATLISFL